MPYTHCCYCRRKFVPNDPDLKSTRDHFVPKSRGGNDDENIIEACHECNLWKGDKHPEDWLKQVERYFRQRTKFRSYSVKDYSQIVGSLRHWLKYFKDKNISTYKWKK